MDTVAQDKTDATTPSPSITFAEFKMFINGWMCGSKGRKLTQEDIDLIRFKMGQVHEPTWVQPFPVAPYATPVPVAPYATPVPVAPYEPYYSDSSSTVPEQPGYIHSQKVSWTQQPQGDYSGSKKEKSY